MKPDSRFVSQTLKFWANVRTISETFGYSVRKGKPGAGNVSTPSHSDLLNALEKRGLSDYHIQDKQGKLTNLGTDLISYFQYRADVINNDIKDRLMDVERAKTEFEKLKEKLDPKCPLPKNKQKNEKKAPAYFTGIINMLVEANSGDIGCDYDPQKLTKFTKNGELISTFARRVDGAFPQVVNPIAIWEIKEYYYTTTFGSRVADGVYETLLDGMELKILHEIEGVKPYHYLMVDAYDTWWNLGKSYLCRIIDMIHMGYIDEALFGYEVIERLPDLVKLWVEEYRKK